MAKMSIQHAAFTAGCRKAAGSVTLLGGAAAKAGLGIRSLGAAMVSALGPIMGFYGAFRLLKISETFQQEMNSSLAIAQGMTPKLRAAMEAQAMELSRTLRASAPDLARAYYYLFSAGLKGDVALKAMPMAARFAQAAEAGVAESTERLTDAVDALGLASKDPATYLRNLAGVADMLGRQAMNADATISEFADALTNKAASSLKTFQIPLSDGMALLGAFAMNAQKGEEAGTGFDIMLRNLTSSSVAGAAKLKGIDIFDEDGMIRAIGMFEDFERVMRDMTPQEKVGLFEDIGIQARARNRILMLAGMSKELRGWSDENKRAQGTIQQIAEKQLPAFTAAWVKLKAVIEAFSIIKLGPWLQSLGEGMGLLLDISHNADAAADSMDRLAGKNKGVSMELQGMAWVVGAVADAFHFLKVGWLMVETAILTGIEGIILAMSKLAEAIEKLLAPFMEVSVGTSEWLSRLQETFGIMADESAAAGIALLDEMKPSQQMLMEKFRQDMEKLRRAAAKPWDTFAGAGGPGGDKGPVIQVRIQPPELARAGSEQAYDLIRRNRDGQKTNTIPQQQLVQAVAAVNILERVADNTDEMNARLDDALQEIVGEAIGL